MGIAAPEMVPRKMSATCFEACRGIQTIQRRRIGSPVPSTNVLTLDTISACILSPARKALIEDDVTPAIVDVELEEVATTREACILWSGRVAEDAGSA